jgi:hypothetical protein
VRYILPIFLPLIGALISIDVAFTYGAYWWTLLPLVAGIAWPLAKGKGERGERFDDKKQVSEERAERIFSTLFDVPKRANFFRRIVRGVKNKLKLER